MRGQEVREALLHDRGIVLAFDLDDLADFNARRLDRHGAVAHAQVHFVAGSDLGNQHAVIHLAFPVFLRPFRDPFAVVGAHLAAVDAEERRAGQADVHRQNRDARLGQDVHNGLADGSVHNHVHAEFDIIAQRQSGCVADGGLTVGVVVEVHQIPAALRTCVLKALLDELAEHALFVDVAQGDGVRFRACDGRDAQNQDQRQYQGCNFLHVSTSSYLSRCGRPHSDPAVFL